MAPGTLNSLVMFPEDATKTHPQQPITIVFTADEKYAVPLAAAIQSVFDSCGKEDWVQVYVIDCGLHDNTLAMLQRSWSDLSFRKVEILKATELDGLEDIPVWGFYGPAIYYRLKIDELLPSNVERALYLDCDMLVFEDLSPLFFTELQGKPLACVRDAGMPFASERGEGTLELGLEAHTPYFNSGMLLLDLESWRREGYGDRVLRFITENQEWIRWPDQDALNAVFKNQWLELPVCWNAFMGYVKPNRPPSHPLMRRMYAQLGELPAIGHFVAIHKPWDFQCPLYAQKLFQSYLQKTVWKDWRPPATVRLRPHPPQL